MSEEEKKAIERFSKAFEYLNVWNKELIVVPEDKKYFLTVLNLLEKKDIDIIEAKEANRQLSVELQKKDKIIDELSTMVFDSRNLTFVDYKQFKDRKKEIIKYAEEQATGKAM